MDTPHRARGVSREPSLQRHRKRTAGYLALAARLASARSGAVGHHQRLPSTRSNVAEYHFSDAGRELKPVIEALGGWGVRWAFDDPKPEELDAGLLVWKIHQRIDRERLPDKRTVIEFDFKGRGGRHVWLVLEPREVSVCVTPPRFDRRPHRPRGTGALLSCLAGSPRLRHRHAMWRRRRRRPADPCPSASTLVHVESDGAVRAKRRTLSASAPRGGSVPGSQRTALHRALP